MAQIQVQLPGGQTGFIDSAHFDPSTMKQVGGDPTQQSQQPGQVTSNGVPTSGGNGSKFGGIDSGRIQAVLERTMLSNPKTVNELKPLWDMVKPAPAKTPTATEQSTVQNELNALQKIKASEDLVNGGQAQVGGIGGAIANLRLQHPLINSILPGAPNSQTASLFDNLLQLQTLGERGQVGGRLTGYLLNRLGPGYPQLVNQPEILKQRLGELERVAQQDLQSTAQLQGYGSANNMPGVGDFLQSTQPDNRPSLDSFNQ